MKYILREIILIICFILIKLVLILKTLFYLIWNFKLGKKLKWLNYITFRKQILKK